MPAQTIQFDRYVMDVLMRDLTGHDRSPAAFLIYLHLWASTNGRERRKARWSHQAIADSTGLSKSAVQAAIRRLLQRQLITSYKRTATATPEYQIKKPWKRFGA